MNYKQNAKPDHELAAKTETFLRNKGYEVFRDESKLRGGENWPQKVLDNVTKADCMICFVSNSSMRSRWVLNEIDEALNLNKPLIPIMVEPLDNKLNFTKYRPRFADIQYICYKGDFELLSSDIITSLKEIKPGYRPRQIIPYHEIVSKTLAKYGFDNPTEVLCWFLEFLQDFHLVPAAGAEANPAHRVPKWIYPGTCRSMSEAIADAINQYASMYKHNFEIGRRSDDKYNWWWEERLRPSACLAEILNTVISEWQPHVERFKEQRISKK
jgi:hypothetical protein